MQQAIEASFALRGDLPVLCVRPKSLYEAVEPFLSPKSPSPQQPLSLQPPSLQPLSLQQVLTLIAPLYLRDCQSQTAKSHALRHLMSQFAK